MQVGRKVKVHIQDQGGDSKYPALTRLAEGLKDTGANLNSSIRQAVQVSLSSNAACRDFPVSPSVHLLWKKRLAAQYIASL